MEWLCSHIIFNSKNLTAIKFVVIALCFSILLLVFFKTTLLVIAVIVFRFASISIEHYYPFYSNPLLGI